MSEAPPEKVTSSGSGSPTANPASGLITQKRWRVAGVATTAGAALMAWYGVEHLFLLESLPVFVAYWAIFLALIVATLYIAMLDLRYTHLQYTISQRDLFRQTWEDESFRRALIEAKRKDHEADRS